MHTFSLSGCGSFSLHCSSEVLGLPQAGATFLEFSVEKLFDKQCERNCMNILMYSEWQMGLKCDRQVLQCQCFIMLEVMWR